MILINMEMPKGCASCFLKYGSCASIRKRMDVSKGDRWCPENYRHPDCPLIEVPEDVAPVVHGEWITKFPLSTCSVCEASMILNDYADYCPNCGARMDGGTLVF